MLTVIPIIVFETRKPDISFSQPEAELWDTRPSGIFCPVTYGCLDHVRHIPKNIIGTSATQKAFSL